MVWNRCAPLGAVFSVLLAGCGFRDDPPVKRNFALTVLPSQVELVQGGTAVVEVTAVRDGEKGSIELFVDGLPPYVSVAPAEIARKEDAGTVVLSALPEALQQGPIALTVVGEGEREVESAALTLIVRGPAGALDERFGDGGVVVRDFALESDRAQAVAVDAEGRIVAAGRMTNANDAAFAAARWDSLGRPDETFGGEGWVSTNLVSGLFDGANALAVGSGGTLVLAGNGGNDFGLVRYLPDGTLDATFNPSGSPGTLRTDVTGVAAADAAFALLVEPDGGALVAGVAARAGLGDDFALVRYLHDGALDASLGTAGGIVFQDFAGLADQAFAMSRTPAGVAIAGHATRVATGNDLAVAAYLDDGTPEPNFGASGLLELPFSASLDRIQAVSVSSSGVVVSAGRGGGVGGTGEWLVTRHDGTGALDPGFGVGGIVAFDWFGLFDTVNAMLVQADGKILLAGTVTNVSNTDIALVRLMPDGSFDFGFGEGGRVLLDIANGTDDAFALALHPDGRIVVAGRAMRPGTGDDFVVAVFWP